MKKRDISSKIKRSKITDYAALKCDFHAINSSSYYTPVLTGLVSGHTTYLKSGNCQTLKNVLAHPNCNIHRGSYMSVHVLLNLLNELGKRDKMRGLPSILSLFRNEFNKFNNTRARMLDSIYHMTLRLLRNLISGVKTL